MKNWKKLLLACFLLATTAVHAEEISARSWVGTMGKNIPVKLEYTQQGHVVKGTIRYLKSKNKAPILIIGTIEQGNIRLREFEPSGNITGVIHGTQTGNTFDGTWAAPTTDKEFALHLTAQLPNPAPKSFTLPSNTKIAGEYYYQYSENGYQGTLEIQRKNARNTHFSISSVTNAPAHNIADVSDDVPNIVNNSFTYKLPNDPDTSTAYQCEFKTDFYQDFAIVTYTQENTDCGFGFNATVEGIFLKLKKTNN